MFHKRSFRLSSALHRHHIAARAVPVQDGIHGLHLARQRSGRIDLRDARKHDEICYPCPGTWVIHVFGPCTFCHAHSARLIWREPGAVSAAVKRSRGETAAHQVDAMAGGSGLWSSSPRPSTRGRHGGAGQSRLALQPGAAKVNRLFPPPLSKSFINRSKAFQSFRPRKALLSFQFRYTVRFLEERGHSARPLLFQDIQP